MKLKKSLALSLCMLLLFIQFSYINVSAKEVKEISQSDTLVINDSQIGDGIFNFHYEGNWGYSSGYPDRFYEGDEHWFNFANYKDGDDLPNYSIKFKGTGIELYGEKQPALGIYNVYLDGKKIDTIDAYSEEIKKVKLYSKTNLSYGEHVLKVELSKTKNSLSSSEGGEIDYAVIMNPGQENYQNLFNKNDLDNWLKALTYNGKKLANESNYANMFTTHKIMVNEGDSLTWGLFGKDEYVMEAYDVNDNFIKRILSADIKVEEETTEVIGVANKKYKEAKASYTFTEKNVSYVRILGNISTMDSFMVFKNLKNSLLDWPQSYVAYEGVNEKGVLFEKSVLFVGDSITNAVKDPSHPYYGWAGRIGINNNMDWKNAGISSATISTALPTSYPENRVINQLKQKQDYEYVILHGGMNDSIAETTIGEISDSYNIKDFDITTFSGAFEELLYTALKEYPQAKIGYIVNYATPNSTWGGVSADNKAYFRRAKEICEKWNVPYLDLYDGSVVVDGVEKSYSYDILNVTSGENMYGGLASEIHIGSKGYDIISPYIEQWMETLNRERSNIINVTFSGNGKGEGEYKEEVVRNIQLNSVFNEISSVDYWFETENGNTSKTTFSYAGKDKDIELDIQFDNRYEEQLLHVQVTDTLGNIYEFVDNKSFKVDGKQPIVKAIEEEIVIFEGTDLDVTSLFDISWGVSKEGKINYSIEKVNELTPGEYSIECQVIAKNGKSYTAVKSIVITKKSESTDDPTNDPSDDSNISDNNDKNINEKDSSVVETSDLSQGYILINLSVLLVSFMIILFKFRNKKSIN